MRTGRENLKTIKDFGERVSVNENEIMAGYEVKLPPETGEVETMENDNGKKSVSMSKNDRLALQIAHNLPSLERYKNSDASVHNPDCGIYCGDDSERRRFEWVLRRLCQAGLVLEKTHDRGPNGRFEIAYFLTDDGRIWTEVAEDRLKGRDVFSRPYRRVLKTAGKYAASARKYYREKKRVWKKYQASCKNLPDDRMFLREFIDPHRNRELQKIPRGDISMVAKDGYHMHRKYVKMSRSLLRHLSWFAGLEKCNCPLPPGITDICISLATGIEPEDLKYAESVLRSQGFVAMRKKPVWGLDDEQWVMGITDEGIRECAKGMRKTLVPRAPVRFFNNFMGWAPRARASP
jgi:hypothetical protein